MIIVISHATEQSLLTSPKGADDGRKSGQNHLPSQQPTRTDPQNRKRGLSHSCLLQLEYPTKYECNGKWPVDSRVAKATQTYQVLQNDMIHAPNHLQLHLPVCVPNSNHPHITGRQQRTGLLFPVSDQS